MWATNFLLDSKPLIFRDLLSDFELENSSNPVWYFYSLVFKKCYAERINVNH